MLDLGGIHQNSLSASIHMPVVLAVLVQSKNEIFRTWIYWLT